MLIAGVGGYGSGGLATSASSNYDASGYSQAGWDLEQTRALLEEQRAYNSAEAEKTRKWQEEMSNSAVQRYVKDLEAAGLNKWLAVQNGSNGASTPTGATATSSSGDASTPNPVLMKSILQIIGNIISSASGMFRFRIK